ncbi:MAG TPA: hypothetical protein VGP80_05015 [Gemmatimonadales bacterium]|jgi:hypothetical protein|nr:hypothetical protein [Gemmatimonadales bacterium]
MLIRLSLLLSLALQPAELLWGQAAPGDLKATFLGQHPFQQQRLTESSALVVSATQKDIFWTLNDSDNRAELFATDTLGRDRGVVRIEGAENVDWEAMARARCGNADCLYIADTGDNRERRTSVRIYRIREPRAGRDSVGRPNAILTVTYPDKPHNVEAILVTPAQDVYLITKTSAEGPIVFRVPGSAWSRTEVQAERIQTLPIPSNQAGSFLVTDASLGEAGRVAVRTYRYIYFFRFDGTRFAPVNTGFRCDARGLEVQGEGIAWLNGDTLATSSERAMAGGGISRITCGH